MNELKSLQVFRSLIKDGCEWHGDVVSKKWSECLYIRSIEQIRQTLELYELKEGEDFKLDGMSIWIA